jgi:hypothetical protein
LFSATNLKESGIYEDHEWGSMNCFCNRGMGVLNVFKSCKEQEEEIVVSSTLMEGWKILNTFFQTTVKPEVRELI